MKRAIKNSIKLVIFLFGISLLFNACTEDSLTGIIEESGDKQVKRISWNKFTNNIGVNEKHNINTFFNVSNKSSLSKNDFTPTILTDEILMIQDENETHYTFKLDEIGENEEFYNLAIIVDNNQQITESKVFKYIPQENWLTDRSQLFSGSIQIINGVFTLEEIQGALSKGSSKKTEQSCIDSINSYWICNASNGGTIGHNPETGAACGGTSWDYIIDISYGECPEGGTDPAPIPQTSTGDGTDNDCTTCGGTGSGDGTEVNESIETQPTSLTSAEKLANYLGELTEEQIFWANNIENLDEVKELISYLTSGCFGASNKGTVSKNSSSTVCEDSKEFGQLAMEALLEEGVNGDNIDYVLEIINGLSGKAKCIYDKLKSSSSGFQNAIKKFDGEFPVSHLSFAINNSLAVGNYGITYPPENYNITVEISNTQLETISDVGAAIVFAHEVIHAEIFRKMLSAAQQGNLNHTDTNTYTTEDRINYINSLRDNFPGLYDYYWERYHPTWNHNLIAEHYRSTIADIAEEFDNSNYSRETYEDISWVGLRVLEDMSNSIAWDNLSDIEKNRVSNALENVFKNGPSNCN